MDRRKGKGEGEERGIDRQTDRKTDKVQKYKTGQGKLIKAKYSMYGLYGQH